MDVESEHNRAKWLEQEKQKRDTDEYTKAILDTAMRIIDGKEYEHLFRILSSYDKVFKKWYNAEGLPKFDCGLPFWCCIIGVKKEEPGQNVQIASHKNTD